MNYISPNEISNLVKNNHIIVYRKNYVYDITELINNHPGGDKCLLSKCLTDCQKDYEFHRDYAKKKWKKYIIGTSIKVELTFYQKILNFITNKL